MKRDNICTINRTIRCNKVISLIESTDCIVYCIQMIMFWTSRNKKANFMKSVKFKFFYKILKMFFFSESGMCSSNLQKTYSKSLSWTWNLNFPPITVNKKFKFQAQDSNLEYFYFGDLKNEPHFLKKSHL